MVIRADIDQQPVVLRDFGYQHFDLINRRDMVSRLKAQSCEGGIFDGVCAFLFHGGKGEGNATPFDVYNDTKS